MLAIKYCCFILKNAHGGSRLSLSIVWSTADQLASGKLIKIFQIPYVLHNLQPGTQQHKVTSAFKLPTLSVTSEGKKNMSSFKNCDGIFLRYFLNYSVYSK